MVSYRLAHDGCVVFADPRAEGRIDFVICREGIRTWRADHEEFHLKDARGKFAKRFAGAVEALATRKRQRPRSG